MKGKDLQTLGLEKKGDFLGVLEHINKPRFFLQETFNLLLYL